MTLPPVLSEALRKLLSDHVFGATYYADGTPEVRRFFMRCDKCNRIWMHYWGNIMPDEKKATRIGCPCGSAQARITIIPEWQAAYYVLSRWVWRKLILRKRLWDPRMPVREADPRG